jgi:hypothetical protein
MNRENLSVGLISAAAIMAAGMPAGHPMLLRRPRHPTGPRSAKPEAERTDQDRANLKAAEQRRKARATKRKANIAKAKAGKHPQCS